MNIERVRFHDRPEKEPLVEEPPIEPPEEPPDAPLVCSEDGATRLLGEIERHPLEVPSPRSSSSISSPSTPNPAFVAAASEPNSAQPSCG